MVFFFLFFFLSFEYLDPSGLCDFNVILEIANVIVVSCVPGFHLREIDIEVMVCNDRQETKNCLWPNVLASPSSEETRFFFVSSDEGKSRNARP